jgi:hypothetical protein
MVLAFLLGILVATAGTAGASRLITGRQIRDGSVTARDLSSAVRRELRRRAARGPAGPRGATGASGAAGAAGAAGRDGTTGAPGAPGLARAYGRVSAEGTASDARGVVAVGHPAVGEFCVSVDPAVEVAATAPVASIDYTGNFFDFSWVQVRTSGNGCPPGNVLDVRTYKADPGASPGTAVLADAPFTFVVP